jgi:hypothetical protein
MDSARRKDVQLEEEGDRLAQAQSISEALQQQQELPAAGPSPRPSTVDELLAAFGNSCCDTDDGSSEEDDDDIYSDDEDYSTEALVFRSMCREGLVDRLE